ncbi:DUF4129 domain-containing protein [Sandaracinus amylolyticus]|uniref:Protein-glutamine gamma-glutamyltransferase-like C-terminal domain-containing protein n=1 Tax=Sandaracinus amylolyticus TaxID=927083 RepID=A0A0F6YI45_9BACT|nr:DUF4129 domain-containing protein [Sandaracinus amylolyticus]AKF05763.1 hypothetical protein DB32_002912 [Sandaracinus amylolyticus]
MDASHRETIGRRDLSPAGAIDRLDRAFALARAGGVVLAARAWGAGALVAVAVIASWYLEAIEGVRALRPLLVLAAALAWWARAVSLGRVARAHVVRLWADAPIPADAGRARDVARTAGWAAIGLWAGGWALAIGALAGPLGVVLVLPLFAVRGAIAPSWLARSACAAEAGVAALRRAIGDSSGQRFVGMIAELLVLVGALGLYVNALATIAVGMLLARSFFGLDVATLDAFLSVRNTFVLVVVAMIVLVAIEPLRAALSALTWVEARVREEGLDLRIAIDDAIARSRPRRAGARIAAGIAITVALAAGRVDAQALPPPPPLPPGFGQSAAPSEPEPEVVAEDSEEDARAREDAAAILARPEFQDHGDARGRGVRELIERLLEWLFRHRDPIEAPITPRAPEIPLPGPLVFLAMAIVVALLVAILLHVTRPLRRGARVVEAPQLTPDAVADPRERAPDEWVDDAARLAAEGRHREALRALYLATLVALDRRRLIRFEKTLTNGQYLRQMPDGEARVDFRDFTRRFDRTWYGREPASEHDYRACRDLAERIVAHARGGHA